MKENEYQCSLCGGIFEKITPEEEARVELKKFFGDVSVKDCDIVCDDCWEKIRLFQHGFSIPLTKDGFLSEVDP